MITLKEAKNYLRVDFDEDDRLISDLLLTAKKLCMAAQRNSRSAGYDSEPSVCHFCLCSKFSRKSETHCFWRHELLLDC